ncbi:hypothetical protein TNCV_3235181 [Trichonephila clavipes]|nr:hypothetical protein TNCV_3235181 [Trichonephila clavipes]
MRAKAYCAYLSFRDLRRWGACADVSVKCDTFQQILPAIQSTRGHVRKHQRAHFSSGNDRVPLRREVHLPRRKYPPGNENGPSESPRRKTNSRFSFVLMLIIQQLYLKIGQKRDGTKEVPCLKAVAVCNDVMGGVDCNDQRKKRYQEENLTKIK